ncbi:hypothetical protein [Spiroplasma floricola]|uniref:Uncharacterized protein n=1 Tax=Spiroplasma floricola 23-6 TaxID=1336749 RepID=A0A2K8SEX8_9MOLU|nr:hypothetical protein [Spiroplasma floricola]AUB31996.1 hypothetical protein SFLOR_v1c09480 [Spiroplasma floricola 23-6]
MSEVNKKFTNVYLHRNAVKKTYLNSNGNEFAVLEIINNDKEKKYITLSTKLIKNIEFSKEEGKTFSLSENKESPFVQVAIPNSGEITIDVLDKEKNKDKEIKEYDKQIIKANTLFSDLLKINQDTIAWAKEAKQIWVKEAIDVNLPSPNEQKEIDVQEGEINF